MPISLGLCCHAVVASQVALVVKNLPANVGDVRDTGSIPGLGRCPGEGMATHSSILAWRIPMDRGAWWARVHAVTQSWTRLKQLTMHHHMPCFYLDRSPCKMRDRSIVN